MSKLQMLRDFVNERLSAVADEIFTQFERTIAEFEDELRRVKEENRRQQLLESVMSPRVRLHREADVQIHTQSGDPSLNQQITETPQSKEKPVENNIKQEKDQLQEFTTVSVKREGRCSLLQQRQTEHREETQIECGGAVQNSESFRTLPEVCYIVIKDVFSLSDISCKTEDLEKDPSSRPVFSEEFIEQSHPKKLWIFHTEPVNRSSSLQQRKTQEKQEQNQDDLLSDPKDDTAHSSPLQTDSSQGTSNTIKHGNTRSEAVKTHTCSICKKRYKTKRNLRRHQIIHTGEKPYSCSVCRKTYKRNDQLKEHIRNHTGDKPYSCSVCKKTYMYNRCLKAHMRTHTGEKPYSCSVCEKTFNLNCNLQTHIKIHTGVRPYSCSICSKTFINNSHLNAHRRTHTGKRPSNLSENMYRKWAS